MTKQHLERCSGERNTKGMCHKYNWKKTDMAATLIRPATSGSEVTIAWHYRNSIILLLILESWKDKCSVAYAPLGEIRHKSKSELHSLHMLTIFRTLNHKTATTTNYSTQQAGDDSDRCRCRIARNAFPSLQDVEKSYTQTSA